MISAVYPGSFDPITNGHIDIIQRSLEIVDYLHIGILNNSKKKYLLDIKTRISLIHSVVDSVLSNFPKKKSINIESFSGLLVDYCKKKEIFLIIRGLRAVADFEYEYAISLMNKRLMPNVDTIFLMSSEKNSFISSTIVKEVASYQGNISREVPLEVEKALKKLYS